MSLPVKDYRGGLTALSHAVYSAIAEAKGKDVQEIIRQVVHEQALIELRAASLIPKAMRANGITTEDDGVGRE